MNSEIEIILVHLNKKRGVNMFSVFSKLVPPVLDHSILLHIWVRYKVTVEEFNEVYKY
jgi:hypothetical protein